MAHSFRICQKCYFERLNKTRRHWSTVFFNSTNRILLKYSVLAKMRHLGPCGFNISNHFFFLRTSNFEILTIHYSDISDTYGIKMKHCIVFSKCPSESVETSVYTKQKLFLMAGLRGT